MTPARLLRALQDELSEDLKNYRYRGDDEESNHVNVYLQLSDENFIDEKKYPLVMVSIRSVECDNYKQFANVEITIGTYGEEEESLIDLLNISERIRQYLLKNIKLANRFLMLYPLRMEILTDQPYPFRFGYITTQYTIGSL